MGDSEISPPPPSPSTNSKSSVSSRESRIRSLLIGPPTDIRPLWRRKRIWGPAFLALFTIGSVVPEPPDNGAQEVASELPGPADTEVVNAPEIDTTTESQLDESANDTTSTPSTADPTTTTEPESTTVTQAKSTSPTTRTTTTQAERTTSSVDADGQRLPELAAALLPDLYESKGKKYWTSTFYLLVPDGEWQAVEIVPGQPFCLPLLTDDEQDLADTWSFMNDRSEFVGTDLDKDPSGFTNFLTTSEIKPGGQCKLVVHVAGRPSQVAETFSISNGRISADIGAAELWQGQDDESKSATVVAVKR